MVADLSKFLAHAESKTPVTRLLLETVREEQPTKVYSRYDRYAGQSYDPVQVAPSDATPEKIQKPTEIRSSRESTGSNP